MPRIVLAVVLAFFLWCVRMTPAQPDSAVPGVPAARLARLGKGVNLSHWLWLYGGRDAAGRDGYFTPKDAAELRSLGLTHVRLPVAQSLIYDTEQKSLRPEGVLELQRSIRRCTEAGLGVVLDPHENEGFWGTPNGDGRIPLLEMFWSQLAAALADTDSELVFFEIMNEPHDAANARWSDAQIHLAAAIRSAAPRHTIIATGAEWGSLDALLKLKPLPDANVVYSFHCYEPHIFTHQGAGWGWPGWKEVKRLEYPSNTANADEVAKTVTHKDGLWSVREYARTVWNAERLSNYVQQAAEWSTRNRAPIYCGEFGAYAAFTPRESRLAYIRDLRTALERSKIGWAMWDYAGGFALNPGEPGARVLDRGVSEALGLTPKPGR